MKPEILLAALTAIGGLGAVLFAALRFNREDAGAVVEQQSTLIGDMRALNEELQGALTRARQDLDRIDAERTVALEAVEDLTAAHLHCTKTIADLEQRLAGVRQQLRGHETK